MPAFIAQQIHEVIPKTTQVWMKWNRLAQGCLRTFWGSATVVVVEGDPERSTPGKKTLTCLTKMHQSGSSHSHFKFSYVYPAPHLLPSAGALQVA